MKGLNSIKNSFVPLIKNNKTHFIGWTVFIFYESVLVGLASGVFGRFGNYAIHYAINIALFYLNAHFVLPLALKHPRQAIFRLPILFTSLIIAYVLIVFGVDSILIRYTNILSITDLKLNESFWYRYTWRGSYFIGFSTGYFYLITYLKEKNRVSDLEKQKLKSIIQHEKTESELIRAQNAFLKAQINPHFLFNTLSFMHTQTQKTAPKVAETILSLSEMMRYALKSESLDDVAVLTEEIEQVENLIKLHQLRSDRQLEIQLKLKGDLSEIAIIPLILITLAENMFKHGNLFDPLSPAIFLIELQNEDLIIRTENLIKLDKHIPSFNLGLQNINRRLELKYKQHFSFTQYTDEHHYFHTRIVIENICPA